MDEVVPDRSLKRLRLDPKSLAEIVEILRRNDRRAIVKLDDVKVDDPTHADAQQLASAKSVDIVSYWVNPDRPTWGRRHFVYLASGPGGAQYFGDSLSPEVTTVLKDLDDYFGRQPDAPSPAAANTRASAAPTIDDPKVFLIATAVVLLVAVLSFIAGRMTATPETVVVERQVTVPAEPDVNSPATTTEAPSVAP